MDFTYLWMLMYGLTLILVVNLTNLISHAFSRENMVQDPVTHRTHYEVPDPGRFSYRTRREELRTGVWLSTYSIILIVAFVILTVFAFIHCGFHSLQSLVAGAIGFYHCFDIEWNLLK